MSYTKQQIMEQAQVFASGWSLVGGIFDSGYALEEAEQSKAELAEMVGEVTKQRDDLMAALEDMYNGWLYIRSYHGDLYGVGWDRVQAKAEEAIAKAKLLSQPKTPTRCASTTQNADH